MAMNGAPSASAELARASARLHSAAPLAEALAYAVEELRAAARAQAVALALVTPGDEELEYVAAAGPGAPALIGARVSSAFGLMSRTLATAEITLASDVRQDREPLPLLDQLIQARTRALMAAPLTVSGHALGVLQVLNPIGRPVFDDRDRPVLIECAALIASALVQRGEHRRLGLAASAMQELELKRQWAAWSPSAEAFLRELVVLGTSGRPFILHGEPGSGRKRAARALASHLATPGVPAPAFVLAEAPDLALAAPLFRAAEPCALPVLSRLATAGGTLHLVHLGAVPSRLAPALAALLTALCRPGAAGGAVRVTADVDARAAIGPGELELPSELRRWFGEQLLAVPPLATRAADVPAITGTLVRDLRRPLGSAVRGFDAAAMARLAAEPWSRNIDSLRQRVAAMMLASDIAWIGGEQVAEQLAGTTLFGQSQGPAIARALTAPEPWARAAALRRLEARNDRVPPAALPGLLAVLEDPLDWLRAHAARLLAIHPERTALRPLLDRLDQEADPIVRRELLAALGRLAAPASAEPVLRHLRDADPDVRAAALLALGRIGGEVARTAAETMASDPDPRVRATALGAGFLIEASAASAAPTPPSPSPPPAPRSLPARLVILPPAGQGEPQPRSLAVESLTIGRAPENALSLLDSAVSKRHATLFRRGEDWVLRDDGSTNGTRVNGIRIAERALAHGDEIRIGTYGLRFETAAHPIASETALADDLESTLFRTAAPLGRGSAAGKTRSAAPSPTASSISDPGYRAVERLATETRSADREARRWAARVLGDLGQGVERLIELAGSDPDPEVRLEATRALGRSQAPAALAALQEKLGDRWLRIAAIEALGILRAPAAVDPLLALLRDERSSRVRRAAIRALGQIGEERAAPHLAELLVAPTIAADAIDALALIGGPTAASALTAHLGADRPLCPDALRGISRLRAPEAVQPLIDLLGADDQLIASRAEEALTLVGQPAVEPLIAALAIPAARAGAMRALAVIGDPAAAEALFPYATSSSAARAALRRLGRQSLPALFAGLEREPMPACRLLAALPESEWAAVTEHLVAHYLAAEATPEWVAPLLAVFGARAVEPLRKLVREASPPVQRRALRALGRIGEHGAQAAVPELLAAFGAPDGVGIEALRAAAAVADVEVSAAIHRSWNQLGPAERAAAARALVVAAASWSDEAAASALASAIDDPDPRVRAAAVLAVAERPGVWTAELLARLRNQDPDPQVQAMAAAVSERVHRELAAHATALLAARHGTVTQLLHQRLSGHERERWDSLLAQLAAGGEDASNGIVLDALLELGERA